MKTYNELISEGLIKRQAGVDLRSKIEGWIKEHELDFKRSGISAEVGDDLSVEVNVKNDIFLYIYLFSYKKDLRANYEVPDYIHFKKAAGKHIVLNHLNASNWATVLDKFDVTDLSIENSNIADEDVQDMMPEGEFSLEISQCDKVVNPKFQKKHLTSFVKFAECKNLSSVTLQGCRGEYTQLWVRYCPKFSEIKVIGECKRLHRVVIDGTKLAKGFEQELTSTYPRKKFKELKIEVEKLPMFKELIEKFPDLSMLTTDNYSYEKKFSGSWVVKPGQGQLKI
jgi:hypothetical protein